MNRIQYILLFIFFTQGWLQAQTPDQTNILSSFNIYRNQNLQEKLFVHTDKSLYLTGEICWFKVYAVDGSFHKQLDLSKMVYVDILTAENKPVMQAMIAMQDGSGSGSLLIPTSLTSGAYKLRAYTNYMKNYAADFYFEKQISIVNTLKKPIWKTEEDTSHHIVQFFPEGGNLVSGINSLLAFKINDKNGRGVEGKGTVVNQDNEEVANFSSLKFGMGQFYFKPMPGNTYKATIITQNHNTIHASLPTVSDNGWVMHAQINNEKQIKISVSENNLLAAATVYLFVHTRLSVKTIISAPLKNGRAEFTIDKNILGDGISQFTLFDPQQKPVCERLFFKRPSNKLNLNIGLNSIQYGKRQKTGFDITATNNASERQMANMSVAVVLVDELQQRESEDILSYLWLKSDLKGWIENPAYYFYESSTTADEAADNLMLTQGWRRFEWNTILKDSTSTRIFLPETDGHILKGIVTNKKTSKPQNNIAVFATVTGQPFSFKSAISNPEGQFIIDMPLFYGTNEMIVQTNYKVDSNYRVNIANPFSEKYTSTPLPGFDIPAQFEALLSNRNISTQVQQLYWAEKANLFYANNIDSSNFYGSTTASTYYLDDYTRFITLEDVIREYVKELRIRKSKDQFGLEIRDSKETVLKGAPLVLLDGMPVFDINKLIALDPLKIRKIEVIQKQYFYGPMHVDGLASFSSYKADLAGIALDPSALLLAYPGLQLQREFYSPGYNNAEELSNRLPDFRNTLYWNPFVTSNKKGKSELSFFTSDQIGKYAIVVEGITADGLAGSSVEYITVK